MVGEITRAFDRVNEHFRPLQPDGADLKRSVTVQYSVNADAYETGPHVATVTIDLLSAEVRDARLDDVLGRWRDEVGAVPDVISLRFTEPAFGPAGRPIEIRVQGDDLARCADASRQIQGWLARFDGVYDVFDDLRPGKRELQVSMKPGGRSLGVSARDVASELRAAFFGETVGEVRVHGEDYEIDSRFAAADRDSIADVEDLRVAQSDGSLVHLSSVADIQEGRGYARVARVDSTRTVTIQGEVDTTITNVSAIMGRFQQEQLPILKRDYPNLTISVEGEVANGAETSASLRRAFLIGMLLIFCLLSFQFRSYVEPLVVMLAIPMCLIGVIWGHILLGHDLTMPSMLGFVSLAGVVVNDSILLVEFIKNRRREGDEIRDAARRASRLRFRAVLLTSVTTIVGMLPLMSETSLQAQVLIPLAISIVFGLLMSTVLVLLLIPAIYTILGDLGLASEVEDAADGATGNAR